ncbi:macrophage scavenger receptor types I and II-like [Phyllobates terribilis]|uniref:macrophage scavenger receptor types I and II-like n=1 Tax=Phyllobates terribilis TaxID=111132 RepID=UPI003CCA81A6
MAKWTKSSGNDEDTTCLDQLEYNQLDDQSIKSFIPSGNKMKSVEKKLKIAIVAIVILYIIVLGLLVFTIKLQGHFAVFEQSKQNVQEKFHDEKKKTELETDNKHDYPQIIHELQQNFSNCKAQISLNSEELKTLNKMMNNATLQSKKNEDQVQNVQNTVNFLTSSLDDSKVKMHDINITISEKFYLIKEEVGQQYTYFQNASMNFTNVKEKYIILEQEMKEEVKILNQVINDLKLKDWEQSITLKNLSLIQGPPGPKGDKGSQGSKGSPGMYGLRGPPGLKGEPGLSGVLGLPGSKGENGQKGEKGEKGDKGEKDVKGERNETVTHGVPTRIPIAFTPMDSTVRLVGGTKPNEGRVEVFHYGQWGTICDDHFDLLDGNVVCRMLGYRRSTFVIQNRFGAGYGRIWMDDVECLGTERSIKDCKFKGWGMSDCTHREDVGVICAL